MNVRALTPAQDDGSEDDRVALSKEAFKHAFLDNLFYVQGKIPALATKQDYYMALAYTVRDRMLHRWISTAETYTTHGSRTIAYLSAEFLMGPHLGNNLINLGIYDEVSAMVSELGLNFRELLACEDEPGLGNGGLGRLAACFLDSMATLELPSIGYGIRYEFGIFQQEIVDGWQIERTDKWLRFGNPWEVPRPEWAVDVKLGGSTETYIDHEGRCGCAGCPTGLVSGVPYDTPILGYQNNTANTLRLWRAEAPESFDFAAFNSGDYYGAVNQKVVSENLSKVLYPNDEGLKGKELRLEQQYFFVCCSLQDMMRILRVQQFSVTRFHEKFAVQLNDTHPPSRSPSSCACWSMSMRSTGIPPGPLRARPSVTPTTPCCPRPWSTGPSPCLPRSCRGTWRSSTKSTPGSSTRCGSAFSATRRASSACRSSMRIMAVMSAWRTSPASAATPSTVWPICTPNWSSRTC
jgi:starch phosphorylase